MLELVPDRPSDRDWTRYLLGVAVVIVLVAAALMGWGRSHDPLRALPPAQARMIYESNLKNFVDSCSSPFAREAQVLASFCRNEATLLRRLPDCDQKCQQLTQSFASSESSR